MSPKHKRAIDVLIVGENPSVHIGVAASLRTIQAPRVPNHPILDRDKALTRLQAMAENDGKCLAICGAPAMGKTILASIFCWNGTEKFKDGVIWSRMGPRATQNSVSHEMARIAGCLGVSASRIRKAGTLSKMSALLSDAIGKRRVLLVVDDIWDGTLAEHFRIGGPNSCVIITTRNYAIAEAFAGSRVVHVEHLRYEDTRTLLRDQLSSAPLLNKFIDELARATGGCPLSIVIACANFRRMYRLRPPSAAAMVREFLTQAATRVDLAVMVPTTLRPPYLLGDMPLSLRVALTQSWDTLGAKEKLLLRGTALFPSDPLSFPQQAILKVAALKQSTIHELIDASLLTPEDNGRLKVHQTVADFVSQQGELPPSFAVRALSYWATFSEKYGDRTPSNLSRVAVEAANLEFSIQNTSADSEGPQMVRCVATLATLYEVRGEYRQATSLLRYALDVLLPLTGEATSAELLGKLASASEKAGNYRLAETLYRRAVSTPRASSSERAYVLQNYGVLASRMGRPRQCSQLLSRALRMARKARDPMRTAAVLKNVAAQAVRTGEFAKCRKALSEALRLSRGLPDRSRRAAILTTWGFLHLCEGEMAKARRMLEEALKIESEYEHHDMVCLVLIYLGLTDLKMGRIASAKARFEKAIGTPHFSQPQRRSLAEVFLALCYLDDGDTRRARSLARRALKDAERLGNRENVVNALLVLAKIAARTGKIDDARLLIRRGLTIARQGGYSRLVAAGLCDLAELHRTRGRRSNAKQAFARALTLARRMGLKEELASARFGLAQIAWERDDASRAIAESKLALAIFRRLEHPSADHVRQKLKEWRDNGPRPSNS